MDRHKLKMLMLIAILLLFYLAGYYITYHRVLAANQGHFTYTLDDPYIHMAVAKNLGKHGIWGVTKYEFASCTSSILWPIIVALGFKIFGFKDTIPFYLNAVAGILLGIAIFFIFLRYQLKEEIAFVSALFVGFVISVFGVSFTGMEHISQTLVNILLVYWGIESLNKAKLRRKDLIILGVLSALATAIRFEGIALVTIVAVLLYLRGKKMALPVALTSAVVPVVAYGIFSVANGALFLPNPVVLKSNLLMKLFSFFISAPDLTEKTASMSGIIPGGNILSKLYGHQTITLSLMSVLFVWAIFVDKVRNIWDKRALWLAVASLIVLIHCQFAKAGQWGRYEAYLIALIYTGLVIAVYFIIKEKMLTRWGMAVLVLPLLLTAETGIKRGKDLFFKTPQACQNIYQQQYTMGQFFKRYYNGSTIALNDIGAVNYIADVKCVDLWGLATQEVANAIIKKQYNPSFMDRICKYKRAKVAIVYENGYRKWGGLPQKWVEVGKWKIKNNLVCAFDEVTIYAIDSTETNNLIRNLQDFAQYMPPGIIKKGLFAKALSDSSQNKME